MAEPQTTSNTNSNTTNTGGNGGSNGGGNSDSSVIIEILDEEDDKGCGDKSKEVCCIQPAVICLTKGDVIVVRINRGDLSAVKFRTLAEQTAVKFKAVFPNNNILVIPDSTNYTLIKQPEVHV